MFAWLWAKLSKYLALAGGLVLAIGGALAYGWLKGRDSSRADDDEEAIREATHAQEVDHEVLHQVRDLPDAGTQKVSATDPDSAAGRLKSDWLRDSNSKGV